MFESCWIFFFFLTIPFLAQISRNSKSSEVGPKIHMNLMWQESHMEIFRRPWEVRGERSLGQ